MTRRGRGRRRGFRALHHRWRGCAPLDPSVVVHSVFEPVANVAITAFDVRSSLGSDRRGPARRSPKAYLEVANFAPAPQTGAHHARPRENATIADSRVDIAAGEAYRQVLPLPRRGIRRCARTWRHQHNALDVDDEGYAWIDAGTAALGTVCR